MRVLFLSHVFGRQGGLEIYNLNLVHALRKAGCLVDVWSVYDIQDGMIEGISHIALAPRNSLVRKFYIRFLAKPLLSSRLFLALRRYDLLIVGHPHLLEAVWRPARWAGVSYWAWTYGIEVWGEWPRGFYAGMHHASRIVAISHYTRDAIQRHLPNKRINVIANAVDIDRFRPQEIPEREETVLLTVGRMSSRERYKGHDVVIQALPRIQTRLARPVTYNIVGTGDDVPRLQQLAQELGVGSCVKFLGYVPDEELTSVYNQCDVFVMPSKVEKRSDGQWTGEGFGFTYIEAAACGKPVVGSNQGGAAEAVVNGKTGFTVNPTSVDEIVEAICILIENPDLAARMGAAGRCYVTEQFSQAVFDSRIAKLLQEV